MNTKDNKKHNLKTKHSEIVDYWKDKYINSDGSITNEYMSSASEEVVKCWLTPHCWACGKQVLTHEQDEKYLEKFSDCDEVELLIKMYETPEVKRSIQRCHIIPKSLNGTDEPRNMMLLCKECHAESPDTDNYAAFIRWIYNKKKKYTFGFDFKEVMDKIIEDLDQRNLGITFEMIANKIEFDIEEFEKYSFPKISIHFNTNAKNPGAYIPLSTKVVAINDYIVMKYQKALETEVKYSNNIKNKQDLVKQILKLLM